MFKPISAGLMCLGLVTLGVTMLRGEVAVEQEGLKDDVLLYKAEALGEIAPEFGIEVAGEIGLESNEEGLSQIEVDVADVRADLAEIQLDGPEGRGVSVKKDVIVKFAHPAIDPAARESLEKIIKQLRDDEAKLREAGRMEEAAQKAHTAGALEAVISGRGPFGKVMGFRTGGGPFHDAFPQQVLRARVQAEQASLQARLAELHAKRAAVEAQRPGSPELADIDKAIAELSQKSEHANKFWAVRTRLADARGAREAVHVEPRSGGKQFIFTGGSDADLMKRKAEAMLHAADVLSKAGLDDKARELKEKGEKARDEAARLQSQFLVEFTHPVGPPGELHRTLSELREQVQQLRKEVAELRTLLEKKP